MDFFGKPNNTVENPILGFWYNWILGITFDGPGMGESLEFLTSRFIKVKSGVWMVVQKGGRDFV